MRKRKLFFIHILLTALLIFSALLPAVYAGNKYNLYVNGELVKSKNGYPTVKNDVIYVPIKAIVKGMGDKYKWDSKKNTFAITKSDGTKIKITANKATIYINGKSTKIEAKAFTKNEILYVPLSIIKKNLKYTVKQNKEDGITNIYVGTTNPKPTPTPTPEPTKAPEKKEAKKETFYGVEIVGVDKFMPPKEGWSNNYEDLYELKDVLKEKYPHKEGLYIGTTEIEFSHLDSTSNALELVKSGDGYKIILRARLRVVNEYGSEKDAKLNRDILKIFLMKITPEYETVYEAIYDSFETDDTHGINTKTYTNVGDTKIKVDLESDDGVVYIIKPAN